MSDIRLLHPVAKAPRPEVVKIASDLLNSIAAGSVDGFALVVLNKDGTITSAITPMDDWFRVIGAIDRLKHRMHVGIDKEK